MLFRDNNITFFSSCFFISVWKVVCIWRLSKFKKRCTRYSALLLNHSLLLSLLGLIRKCFYKLQDVTQEWHLTRHIHTYMSLLNNNVWNYDTSMTGMLDLYIKHKTPIQRHIVLIPSFVFLNLIGNSGERFTLGKMSNLRGFVEVSSTLSYDFTCLS